MAIDNATFVATYAEFEEINDLRPAVVTSALTRAQAFVSQTVWGDRYEAGVFAKAAALLAQTGFGENARIQGTQKSIYDVTFSDMVRALPMRVLVSGGFGDS